MREKEARSLIGNVQKEVHLPNIERIDGGALAVLSRNCRYLELGLKNLSLEQAKILGRGFGTLNLPNITRSRLGGKYEYINKRQGSLSFKDFYRGCIII